MLSMMSAVHVSSAQKNHGICITKQFFNAVTKMSIYIYICIYLFYLSDEILGFRMLKRTLKGFLKHTIL
jgi:hypothetical protein